MDDSDDEEFLFATLLLEEEEEEESRRIGLSRKRKHGNWVHDIFKKRDEFGEFHTLFPDLLKDDVKFFQYFRMSQSKFYGLVELLKPDILKQNTKFRRAIEPEERLALCLRFLATGNSFRSLAFSFRIGERSVRRIVYSTCEAIIRCLQPIVMPKPTEETWNKSEKGFCERWNFPNAIASIDGKHCSIQCPPHSGTNYYCYKKHFSLVLLALVNADKKFIAIDVGAYGKNSDANIFRTSAIGKGLFDGTMNIPPPKIPPGGTEPLPHVIIGDEAFPLDPHLMRPYSRDDAQMSEDKKVFNYRLSRGRNTVEDTFGILTKKFRIYERRLCMSPEHIVTVVMATCCLHNYLRDDTCYWTESDLKIETEGLQDIRNIGGNPRSDASAVRDGFTRYFNSVAGATEWQLKRVRAGRHDNV